jgi:GntR family transcriptional repressor for pyruvate dehydrogenase complex
MEKSALATRSGRSPDSPKTLETAPRRRQNDLTFVLLERFRELLADGSIAPGSRLPPERELAKRFGVSRNSLRQALKVLEAIGVVQQRTGAGTHLRRDASGILHEPFRFMVLLDAVSHEELFEARIIVEPELAARAASRATLPHIDALRNALESMVTSGGDSLRAADSDVAFHSAIMRAAGNRICESMFSVLLQSLKSSIILTSRHVDVPHTLKFHRAILEAIDKRDPAAARQAMLNHLLDAQAVMMRAAAPSVAHRAERSFAPVKTRADDNRGAGNLARSRLSGGRTRSKPGLQPG